MRPVRRRRRSCCGHPPWYGRFDVSILVSARSHRNFKSKNRHANHSFDACVPFLRPAIIAGCMVSEVLMRGRAASTISGLRPGAAFMSPSRAAVAARFGAHARNEFYYLVFKRRYARHNLDEDLNNSSESKHYGAVSLPKFNLLKSSERLVLML